MKSRTYTLLVTLSSETPPSKDELANHLWIHLEATGIGAKNIAAAAIDAFDGDHLIAATTGYPDTPKSKAKRMHAALRRP